MATDNEILKELMETAPGLAGISRENPYKVPRGYFENLVPQGIPAKQAPVRSISFGRRAFKYAAAAVVAGLIALTIWYAVPEKNNAIVANLDNAVNVRDISDDEIENYINGDMSALSYEASMPAEDIKDEDIRLMFREISDSELETFLN